MYKILIKKSALKSLERFPLAIVEAIDAAICELAINPRPPGCKKLKGTDEPLYRVRRGDYRIIYTIEDEILTVEIIKISKRDQAYK